MNVQDMIAGGGGILLIVLTLIQVAPIRINPWSWLGKAFGRIINGEVLEKVDQLNGEVNELGGEMKELRAECEEREANTCRTRIMRFGDELLHDVHHSKEHFEQILMDIKTYEDYCEVHPKYRNNIATATILRIKKTYDKCIEEKSFL